MDCRKFKFILLFPVFLLCSACTYLPYYPSCCNNYGYTNPYLCNTTTTDRDITEAVQVRIHADPGLRFLDIRVFTYMRVVTLKGAVENPIQRNTAINIAKCVPGVMRVKSKLIIRSYDNT